MALSGEFGTSNQYIKYYFEFIENWTDTPSNISNVTVRVWVKRTNTYGPTYGTGTVYVNIAGGAYSAGITTSQKIGTTPILIFEKNLNVGHNADGTGRCDVTASISHQEFSSGDNSWGFGLTTIPRASQITANVTTQTMGQQITFSTNRASVGFTHTLVCVFGGYTANIAFDVTDSFVWTVPLELANQIPSAESGWGGITCHTYSGGTLIGSTTINFTAIVPSNILPSFTTVTHSENVANIQTKIGAYVQNLSKLNLAITGAAGTYGSSITKYEIDFDGALYTGSSIVTNVIKGINTLAIIGSVTDSRGRKVSKSVNVTVLPYEAPKLTTFTLERCNSDGTLNALGTYAKVTRIGTWNGLNAKNALSVKISSRNRGGSTWTLKNTFAAGTGGSLTGNIVLGTYVATSSHDFMIELVDQFNTTISLAVLATGEVTMSWGKAGIGIGKIWEKGALDVKGDVYIEGNITASKFTGLLDTNRIPANADLNNYQEVGFFSCPLDSEAATMWNRPNMSSAFTMRVQKHAGVQQTITTYLTTGWVTWKRNMYSNSWGAWRRVDSDQPLAFAGTGSAQNLNPSTWLRADFYPVINSGGIFNDSTNYITVPDEGDYLITYTIRINQSINTRYVCQFWGNANAPISILDTITTNNGWNHLVGSAIAHLYIGNTYEFVIKQEDGSYVRTVDGHTATVTRIGG